MISSLDYIFIRTVLQIILGIAVTVTVVFYTKAKPEWALWSAYVAWALLGLLFVAFLHEKLFSETDTSGLLRPASEPTPPTPCGSTIPKGALILLLGDSASYTTASHQTVIKVAGEDLLSIDRKDSGIAITAKIFSADRRIVAKITDNEFAINPSNYFRRERPDHHTLAVFDQQDQRVLYVRYLNASAIKLLGTFHTARGIVRINEHEVVLPGGGSFARFCFGNINVNFQID